jgi:Ca2+-binding RTX toxin-like protein
MGGPRRATLVVLAAAALAALAGAPGAQAAAAPASAPDPPASPGPAELPTCAEGPERVGDEILGTPCSDRIVAPASVAVVDGGPGDDTIVGANSGPVAAATGSPESGLHLEVGSQTFNGGPGNDVVYGDRGNDVLRGGPGNDRLYGGIGDDVLEGGEGDDFLSGGFGTDRIDGQEGSDFVRGDATIDHIFDSGLAGTDTLSFATGMTPGFTAATNPTGAADFPGPGEERGVFLKLGEGGVNALDGEPSLGGGNDEVQPGAFERIVGTPFSDYIVGSAAAEEIFGGGGADVIKGGGGADRIFGGADGDLIEGAGSATVDGEAGNDNCLEVAAATSCEGTAKAVEPRDTSKVSVGETGAGSSLTQVYVVGSSGGDGITATYGGGSVVVSLAPGTSFDTGAKDDDTGTPGGGCTVAASSATCPVAGLLDSLTIGGMGGDDTIAAPNFPDGVSVVASGGAGSDHVSGGPSEDVLVDGEDGGSDRLEAGAGDDALTHNAGADFLDGGEGSDLFLSVALCTGTTIAGGVERVGAPAPDRDNSSWAKLEGEGVDARLDSGLVGRIGPGEQPECAGGSFDHMEGIEDLEGSSQSDVLYGNEGENQLLGHKGADAYFALGGNDSILANSGSADRVINCGPGFDQATIDLASKAVDPAPIECERVREGAVEEFNEQPLLSEPPPPVVPAPPKPDRTPPRTQLLRHPAKLLKVAAGRRKLVAFRFAANEAGSHFQCKLDRGDYAGCRSPRKYRVAAGRHVFRVLAVDAAGNRDRSPSVFQFRVAAARRPPPHGRPAHAAR